MPSREAWTSSKNGPMGISCSLNKTKCKVLHLGQGNPWCQSRLGDEQMEGSPGDKGLGELVDERLHMRWPDALSAQKAICVLGCIKSGQDVEGDDSSPLLCSALMRPTFSAVSSSGVPAQEAR
ncbi:hypothetical protein BTVI_107129 [Pitangus sulphuratus]|nr:hypothetical protein BTVI_107129 [Pitangus sulphuratus]